MLEPGKIIRIRDWTMLDELSNPVEAKRVTFTYPDKTPTHVDIPVREFSAERVRAAIDEAIATWHEVKSA